MFRAVAVFLLVLAALPFTAPFASWEVRTIPTALHAGSVPAIDAGATAAGDDAALGVRAYRHVTSLDHCAAGRMTSDDTCTPGSSDFQRFVYSPTQGVNCPPPPTSPLRL